MEANRHSIVGALDHLQPILLTGRALTREEAADVAACPDLVSVGVLGESVRKAMRGDRVTFARVAVVSAGGGAPPAAGRGAAQEVRLVDRPASLDDARARVTAARSIAEGVTLTGFSTADLLEMADHDHVALAGFAKALAAAGLAGVAETPIDRLGDVDEASEVVRAVRHGGLGVWRFTVDRASPDDRLTLIARAAAVAADVGGILAFAPLSREDRRDVPSTGYDDVKTVAIARVMCRSIPSIQVDWALYGPKLAQVAIAYGADDLDAVSPYDDPAAGAKRAPRAEIERHIRAAYAEPAERSATYEILS
jgi:CofH/MqnC C-terminal region